MPFTKTGRERNVSEICPLYKPQYGAKADFLSKKNALNYTQYKNKTFRSYAPYRSRDKEENLNCSPRKMPFTLHTITTKRFEDMPHIEAEVWQKS